MCIKWPWSTAHCIKWEPHMEPCKHVSAWEDCCDYRGRVLISPRKLSCQGWSYSMAINCWPWGPGCMHFFWLYNLSEAFGPECLRRVLHVLFHQSATTPYCLRAALGFLVFPLRSWTLSKISLWPLLESSPPLGLVAWQTEGLLFTFLFCTGTGGGGGTQLDHTGFAEELTVRSEKWHEHKWPEHSVSECLQRQLWEGQWLEHMLLTCMFVCLVHGMVKRWAKTRPKQPKTLVSSVFHQGNNLGVLPWVPGWVTSSSLPWACFYNYKLEVMWEAGELLWSL